MPENQRFLPGTFCWADLMTSDIGSAVAFYQRIFGWEMAAKSLSSGHTYVTARLEGRRVCGLVQRGLFDTEVDAPTGWLPQVMVTSVDAACTKVNALKGRVLAVEDIERAGRLATILDPDGARVGLWQARHHHGADVWRNPGAIEWNELVADNVDIAGKFYIDLLGWKPVVERTERGVYTTFFRKEHAVAGLLSLQHARRRAPQWVTFFGAADCRATARQIERAGGHLITEPADAAGVGCFALARDPTGGAFGILQRL